MNELKVVTTTPLEKDQIIQIAKVVNATFEKKLIGGKGKKIADIKHYDDIHVYLFFFEAEMNTKTCDALVSEMYVSLDFNFMVELETNIEEDYLEPADDEDEEVLNELSETVQHSRWMNEQSKNGWRYGMDYDEMKKTNPYMRPHHMLTKSQRDVFKKSKEKLGFWGIYSPYIGGGSSTGDDGKEVDVGDMGYGDE